MSIEYNSLNPSGMAHKDQKWPKTESTIAIKREYSARLCEIFNTGEYGSLNQLGYFKGTYYNPKEFIFQHMSVKEQVFNDNKTRWEEMNRFTKGYIIQHLTSVDSTKLVHNGAIIPKFFESFICDNLEFNPFEEFVVDMTVKRNKVKKEKKTYCKHFSKKQTNSVYGYTLGVDIKDGYKYVSNHWMGTEYDERLKEWFPIKNGNVLVKINDHDGVDNNGYS